MTLTERLIQARGTFDEERSRPVPCRCGRLVSGVHDCQQGCPCPWAVPLTPGKWGVLWADPDQEGAE